MKLICWILFLTPALSYAGKYLDSLANIEDRNSRYNQPQIVELKDLAKKYSCDVLLKDPALKEKIRRLWEPYIQSQKNNFDKHLSFQETYQDADQKLPGWSSHWTLKEGYEEVSAQGKNDLLPGWIFKFSFQKDSLWRNPLRVPMAALLADIVQEENLTDLFIPKKCLIPIFEQKDLDLLDETHFGLGYIVMAEEVDFFSDSLWKFASLDPLTQKRVAEQTSILIGLSGLFDNHRRNIVVTKAEKIAFIDTEPTIGEMSVHDTTGIKLRQAALDGLIYFEENFRYLSYFSDAAHRIIKRLRHAPGVDPY